MKRILLILVWWSLMGTVRADSNAPVRLALISETAETRPVAEVLTAQLSGNAKVQLVERDEVEKVYQEQSLSAGNRDYVKLGQLLGADGLLLLREAIEGTNEVLRVRLVAVKPGVVLAAEKFSWVPTQDPAEWAPAFAGHMNLFLPKLAVEVKDAIPLSVVNLRSAITSGEESRETERQLKLLIIQRLSQEPHFFVLERQRMELLSEEKDLKADDSTFWNGSYLLEGVVDQNGYDRDTVTINARLTPPKGGAPLLLKASGSRTNLTEVINQLADGVNEALKVQTTIPGWNSADEATQYFKEGQWALRWGIAAEAQAAAESAWGLGKRDLEGELLRIRAYLLELNSEPNNFQNGRYTISSGFDVNGKPLGPAPADAEVQETIARISASHPHASISKVAEHPGSREIIYVYPNRPPETGDIGRAQHALELYAEFDRSSPDGEPKVLSRDKNSDWYQLGIDDLVTASQVLQEFNLFTTVQEPVAEQLAGLRAAARSVAALIAKSPTVRDGYFVGDRIVSHDELSHTMEERPSIFRCQLDWGCFWQEKPEDAVALYRELMASPVFCYLHHDLWDRPPGRPRLAGWNEADQQRIPVVWADFIRELSVSTNVLWQMEAKALAMSDAPTEEESKSIRAELMELIRANRQDLVENNVELFYLNWGLGYPNAELDSMDQEYWQNTYRGKTRRNARVEYEKQKAYLKNNTPYEWTKLMEVFENPNYTRTQAEEMLPLLLAYETNLLVQAHGKGRGMEFQAGANRDSVEFFVTQKVRASLNPAPPPVTAFDQRNKPAPAPPSAPAAAMVQKTIPHPAPEPVETITNVLPAGKFLAIPLEGLPGDKIGGVTIKAHQWLEGKLLLDFEYGAFVYSFDAKGDWQGTRSVAFPAIAILDPVKESWQVVSCPEVSGTSFSGNSTLLHGELFTSANGQIRKYDFNRRQWEVLAVSDGENYQLFSVNDGLYAANHTIIFEIQPDGKASHILASARRQPPVSLLDTQMDTPVLFAGPGKVLMAGIQNKIFAWTGGDWREDLEGETNPAVLSLSGRTSWWKLPPKLSQAGLPAAVNHSDLYLLAGHSELQPVVSEEHIIVKENVVSQDGYNAMLYCLSPGLPQPLKIYLNFAAPDGRPPVSGTSPAFHAAWPGEPSAFLLFAGDILVFASETQGFMPPPMAGMESGYKTGVWLMPLTELDPVVARQKQEQLAEIARTTAVAEQHQKSFMDKYDLNHDGVIGPEERESVVDDPAFLESELDKIDTNHNGWLDAAELAYFDANQNKILEPKEQAGIEAVERLLAKRLLQKYDRNGDGVLGIFEYDELVQDAPKTGPNGLQGISFNDAVHGGDTVDLDALEGVVKQRLEMQLWPRGMNPQFDLMFNRPMGMGRQPTMDAGQRFKSLVEDYWRFPGGRPRRSAGYDPEFPFGRDFEPSGRHRNTNSMPGSGIPR